MSQIFGMKSLLEILLTQRTMTFHRGKMPDLNVIIRQSNIDPKERARRLAQAYELILSWPGPGEEKLTPAADDLGGNTAAGAATEDIHPASKSLRSDAPLEEQDE